MKPLFDKVLIEREQIKEGLIMLPDEHKKRNAPSKGKIIAIGPDVNTDAYKSIINVGNRVLFGQHAGSWITEDDGTDDRLYICLDVDVLLILDEE